MKKFDITDANVREVLDALDDWFVANASLNTSNQLWDVLTGLRGPDNVRGDNVFDLKMETTAVIRRFAFPRTGASGFTPALFDREDISLDTVREMLKTKADGGWHFTGHVNSAVRALDIIGPAHQSDTSSEAEAGPVAPTQQGEGNNA